MKCRGWPSHSTDSTYSCLPWLSRTRKSPECVRSSATSARGMAPWYHTCSCRGFCTSGTSCSGGGSWKGTEEEQGGVARPTTLSLSVCLSQASCPHKPPKCHIEPPATLGASNKLAQAGRSQTKLCLVHQATARNHSWRRESPGVTVPHNVSDGEKGVGRGDRIWSPMEERGTPVKVAWEKPPVSN